jgi:hypothetical protein
MRPDIPYTRAMSTFPNFDPSKMDPKVLMELSQLLRQLPPEQLQKMQSLMHNMMAGFDVSREMEEFEKTLPPGFREKLMSSMMGAMPGGMPGGAMGGMPGFQGKIVPPGSEDSGPEVTTEASSSEMGVREARLTILRAVAAGQLPPEEAERLLFAGNS